MVSIGIDDRPKVHQSKWCVCNENEICWKTLNFHSYFISVCLACPFVGVCTARWSFGILLYEIVTMGSAPYPTVPVDCLINYLKTGNRMSKPFNCSQDLYDQNGSLHLIEREKNAKSTKYLTISAMTLCIRVGIMNQKSVQHSLKFFNNSIYSFNILVSMESYRLWT